METALEFTLQNRYNSTSDTRNMRSAKKAVRELIAERKAYLDTLDLVEMVKASK
jgi:hypothetical protein